MFFIRFARMTASAADLSLRRALNFRMTVMEAVRSLLASLSSPKVIQGCCSSCEAVHRFFCETTERGSGVRKLRRFVHAILASAACHLMKKTKSGDYHGR
jgi:hypothetical protein